MEILSGANNPRIGQLLVTALGHREPLFIGRIGGSDFDLVRQHFNDPQSFSGLDDYLRATGVVREYNGYFDIENDPANFVAYLEILTSCYRSADHLSYSNPDLITRFGANAFESSYLRFLKTICPGKTLFDYTFIEAVIPFLHSFKVWGEGKRILIVSPFSKSLEYQNQRRNDLIVDYEFPEFELLTYTSPITYNVPGDTADTLGVTVTNWHEQCRLMAGDVSAIEFDVALLSCASYGMWLGDFIRHKMGKKAIYLGGILNVLFNIYGERFDTPFFNGLTRDDTRIDAFENDDVVALSAGRSRPNEALRAYFGHRTL